MRRAHSLALAGLLFMASSITCIAQQSCNDIALPTVKEAALDPAELAYVANMEERNLFIDRGILPPLIKSTAPFEARFYFEKIFGSNACLVIKCGGTSLRMEHYITQTFPDNVVKSSVPDAQWIGKQFPNGVNTAAGEENSELAVFKSSFDSPNRGFSWKSFFQHLDSLGVFSGGGQQQIEQQASQLYPQLKPQGFRNLLIEIKSGNLARTLLFTLHYPEDMPGEIPAYTALYRLRELIGRQTGPRTTN